jgi:lycopene beta-cyclase
MRPSYDIVILGGGMAGLSLATRLTASAFSGWRVAVIEPRAEYVRDKTWCSFELPTYSHPFSQIAVARWSKWQVRRDRETVHTCQHADIAYAMINAADFYQAALVKIASAPHIELLRGVSVTDCAVTESTVSMTTSAGATSARLAFDSRPRSNSASSASASTNSALSSNAWRQIFCGIEIETEQPVFDPTCATLMDFSVMTDEEAQSGRVHFMYFLPISTRHALVEDTWFIHAKDGEALPNMSANIERYMAMHFAGQRYQVHYREQGALAMDATMRPLSLPSRYIAIGAAGGMARAASGYAFFDTQRACDAVATKLLSIAESDCELTRPLVLPHWRSAMSYWMDGVFLRALHQGPGMAPELFYELFRRVPADALARFLSGLGSPQDTMRVVMACPKWRFMRAALGI